MGTGYKRTTVINDYILACRAKGCDFVSIADQYSQATLPSAGIVVTYKDSTTATAAGDSLIGGRVLKCWYVVKAKPFLLSIILVLLTLEDALERWIHAVKYMDELAVILLFLYYLAELLAVRKIRKQDSRIVLLTIILLAIGFAGNHVSGIQPDIKLQVFDAFNMFKFVAAILGGQMVFNHYRHKELLLEYTARAIKCLICISTVFLVINLFADIGMHTDYRYGLRSYNFIFTRVGNFYSACVIWIIILTASMFYNKSRRMPVYIVLAIVNMCSTLRSRAFGFALLYVIVFYAFIVRKEKSFRWWYSLFFLILSYFIAADQFNFYFSGNRARRVLLKYGILTARLYFPYGSGFATYGTAIAQRYYSPLYYKYGFPLYWGLSPDYRAFLTDDFWPAVMAELGMPGIAFMAALLILVILKTVGMTDNQYSKVCVYFGFGTLLMSSLIASSFFSCTTLVIFMCLTSRLDSNIYKSV